MRKLKAKKETPDFWIAFTVFVLLCIGLIMVFSSSQYFAQYAPYNDAYYFLKKQIINAAIGLVGLLLAYKINYKVYRKLAWVALIGTAVLLIAVIVTGQEEVKGAARWIEIAGFRFQPSELCKIALPLVLAKMLSDNQHRIETFKYGFLPAFGVMVISCGLVFIGKDLSTSVIIAATAFIMMFCAGVRLRYLAGVVGLGGVAVAAAIIQEPYRLTRILSFLHPFADPLGAGFQQVQSLLAIGSGGLTGVGLGAGGAKWYYLPERHTDFIYSIVTEETGFIGGTVLILLFILLIWRGFGVALTSDDLFGSLLATGIVTSIGGQAFMNLAVTTGLAPVTGVTLPFISYGGTSLIVCLAMTGMLLNISCFARIKR